MISLPEVKGKRVAPRQIEKFVKHGSDKPADEIVPRHNQPESGRYLSQVDKQTKASYDTAEAAQSAALEIKKRYPIVKVSIFDSIESTNRLIELPSCELNG